MSRGLGDVYKRQCMLVVYVLQGAIYRHIYVILKLVVMPQAYFFAFICMCLFYR